MKLPQLLLVLLVSFITATATAYYLVSTSRLSAPAESVYARIMRTHTIRCAYADWAPATVVDPNSKEISGVYHDLIEEIGRRLNLKIIWAEEVSYSNIEPGFVAGRYDLFCSNIWPNSIRAKNAIFSQSLYYSVLYAYARADDNRFDNDAMKLNDPRYTLSIIEGDAAQAVADQTFPLAKHLAMTQQADVMQMMQDVVAKKADATISDANAARQFTKHNPGTIKNVAPGKPLRVYANTIMMPFGEHDLKSVIDTALGELHADGTIERMVKKYEGDDPPFLFAGKPYAVPQAGNP